jgi:hypothetical protein
MSSFALGSLAGANHPLGLLIPNCDDFRISQRLPGKLGNGLLDGFAGQARQRFLALPHRGTRSSPRRR